MSESPRTPDSSSNTTTKTSGRKLKQARLPFQIISPDTSIQTSKRRKLNDSDENIVLKIDLPNKIKNAISVDGDNDNDDDTDVEFIELINKEKEDEKIIKITKNNEKEMENDKNINNQEKNKEKLIHDGDDDDSDTEIIVKQQIEIENNHKNKNKDDSNELKQESEIKENSLEDNDEELIMLSNDESSASDTKTPSKKSLTPKQLKKKMESAKKREERDRIKQEKEKERLEKKEEKEKLKLEKEKEKEMLKMKKEMQRMEKEKKKQEIMDAKNEEKKLKEEEERKKEERKQAARVAFTSFFVTKNKSTEDLKSSNITRFMPFQIKTDMRLAPKNRIKFKEEMRTTFDNIIEKQITEKSNLYLNQLKDKTYIKKKSNRTWPSSELKDVDQLDEQNDIYIISKHDEGLVQHLQLDPTEKRPKAKLLLFHENQRPPYWGTWRKAMKSINPRKPFAKEEILDYNIDSDLEWEDEEPGESLQGSEDDRESEDEYEVDNEFFVPHGYLSDGENENEDECNETTEIKETNKEERLHKMEIDFEEEMKKKTTRIQPTIIGCIWREDLNNQKISTQLKNMIMSRCALFDQNLPIELNSSLSNTPTQQSPSSEKKFRDFEEEDIKNLVRLVQGNPNSRQFLSREFSSYLTKDCQKSARLSKRQIYMKIKEIAEWKMNDSVGTFKGRLCWMVKPDILKIFNFNEELPIELSWNYILKPKIVQDPLAEITVEPAINICNIPKDNIPLITKFTKVMSKEEKEKQFASLTKQESITTTTNSNTNNDASNCIPNLTNDISNDKSEHSKMEIDDDIEIVNDNKDSIINNTSTNSTSSPIGTTNKTSSKTSSTSKVSKLSNFFFKSNKK